MNLFESSDIRTLDIDQLRAATDRPRVLFVTNRVLGWRSLGDEMVRATADRQDIYALHLSMPVRGLLVRYVTRLALRAQPPAKRHSIIVRSRAAHLARLLEYESLTDSIDVIHVSPHLAGLGVVRSGWQGPLSVLFDASVRQAKSQRQGLSPSEVEHKFRALLQDEQQVVSRACSMWAMSRWAAAAMAAEYHLDPTAIGVVPPVRTVVSRSWDGVAPAGPVRIAFVGNNIARKGGRRLIAWHQDHWRDVAELHIFTMAPNPSGPLPGVVWHQGVDNTAIVTEHLPTMDFFVLPTRSDMSPFAISEAIAVGLPVVSSAIGGIVELVQEGVTGFLLDPDDDAGYIHAIERLLDPGTRTTMGRAALAYGRKRLDPVPVLTDFVDQIVALVR